MAIAVLLSMAGAGAAHADEVEIDCAKPQNTMEVTMCAGREFEEAEKQLDAVYQKALAYQAQVDKLRTDFGWTDPEAVKSMKAAETAWISFRTSNCDALHAEKMGGTAYSAYVNYCRVEMTRNRTNELKKLIGEDK